MRFIRKSWNRLKPFFFSQSWLSREDLNAVTADLVHLNKNKAGVKAFLHQSPHLLLHHRCILRPYYITNIYLRSVLSLISDLMGPPKMAVPGWAGHLSGARQIRRPPHPQISKEVVLGQVAPTYLSITTLSQWLARNRPKRLAGSDIRSHETSQRRIDFHASPLQPQVNHPHLPVIFTSDTTTHHMYVP